MPQQNIVDLDEALSYMDVSILANQKRQEDRSDILKAIAQLPDARRLVIELHYFDGLPLFEIDDVMGKSVGPIYSLHFNALQDLRKILGTNRDNT